jgi:hypothetical protein
MVISNRAALRRKGDLTIDTMWRAFFQAADRHRTVRPGKGAPAEKGNQVTLRNVEGAIGMPENCLSKFRCLHKCKFLACLDCEHS